MKRSIVVSLATLLLATSAVAEPLDALLARARSEGLPVAPLQHKIAEGQAKRVPEARVEQVVGRLLDYLGQARTWLQQGKRGAPEAVVVAVATARLAGVEMAEIHRVLPGKVTALDARRVDALADLHLRGYRGAQVSGLVQAAKTDELVALGRSLDLLGKQTSLTRAELLDALLSGVRQTGGDVARAVGAIQGGGAASKVKGGPWKSKGPKKANPGKARGKSK